MLAGELRTLFIRHLPAFKVGFVANEHDDHIDVCVGTRFLKPTGEVVESVTSGDVVDKKRTTSTSIVGPRDRSERLLPCCVPDLELNLFVLNIDETCAEFHSNGQVMVSSEAFVRELQKKT